jgi:hypothetical protein
MRAAALIDECWLKVRRKVVTLEGTQLDLTQSGVCGELLRRPRWAGKVEIC